MARLSANVSAACVLDTFQIWRCATRSDYLHRLLGCVHAIDRHHRGDIDAANPVALVERPQTPLLPTHPS